MNISKSACCPPADFGLPTEEDMGKISRYAKKKLTPEEVFVFGVTLCDNDIDRDWERFTEECIEELAPLMAGSTGICDHDPKAANQAARLYDCRAEISETEKNRLGAPLMRLTGRAYMLRTPGQAETIARIEGGILREVSISCSVKKQTCSVCGKDIRLCGHIKGREYAGRACFAELSGPADGYEWSFVAVPAQKNAGVTKGAKISEGRKNTVETEVFKAISEGRFLESDGDAVLSAKEASLLSEKVRQLSEMAENGRLYMEKLRTETVKAAVRAGWNVSPETAGRICGKLSATELEEMKKAFEKMSFSGLPARPQTAPERSPEAGKAMEEFRI